MIPTTKAALSALIEAAIKENTDDFADELLRHIPAEQLNSLRDALMRGVIDKHVVTLRTMGEVDGIEEVARKTVSIAAAYTEIGEPALAQAFNKFGLKLCGMAKARAERVRAGVEGMRAERAQENEADDAK